MVQQTLQIGGWLKEEVVNRPPPTSPYQTCCPCFPVNLLKKAQEIEKLPKQILY